MLGFFFLFIPRMTNTPLPTTAPIEQDKESKLMSASKVWYEVRKWTRLFGGAAKLLPLWIESIAWIEEPTSTLTENCLL